MTSGNSVDQPRRLPIQIPPRPGERPISFITRLATANHLRPSHLRIYLNDPPWQRGPIQAWRLAAVTGRTAEELLHLMPALDTGPRRPTRPQLAAALRHAAQHDQDVEQLSRRFALQPNTIIKALTSQTTATRFHYQQPRSNPILDGFTQHLDDLLAHNPSASIRSIWKTLREIHGAPAGYGTVRNYINRVRAQPAGTTSVKYLVSRKDLFARIRAETTHDLVATLATQFRIDHATVTHILTGRNPIPDPTDQIQREIDQTPPADHNQ